MSEDFDADSAAMDEIMAVVKEQGEKPSKEPANNVQEEEEEYQDTENTEDPEKYYRGNDEAALARIKNLARQVHASDERNKAYLTIAERQEERIRQLETMLSQQTYAQNEATLRAALRDAIDSGDEERVFTINQQITDLSWQKKMDTYQSQQAVTEKEKYLKTLNGSEKTAAEMYSSWTADEQEYAKSLAEEKDEAGKPIRPWMDSKDKDFTRAAMIANSILKTNSNISVPELFDMLDEKLKRPSNGEVLSGSNLTRRHKGSRISFDNPKEAQFAKYLGDEIGGAEGWLKAKAEYKRGDKFVADVKYGNPNKRKKR